jgi:hypothetical protein
MSADKKNPVARPLDPTTNAEGLMGEQSDRPGMTDRSVNNRRLNTTGDTAMIREESESASDGSGMVSLRDPEVTARNWVIQNEEAAQNVESEGGENLNLIGQMEDDDVPPHTAGEQAVSGHMPHPESNADVLKVSQDVGLRLDEDEENPQELNIAADVAAAERRRRSK